MHVCVSLYIYVYIYIQIYLSICLYLVLFVNVFLCKFVFDIGSLVSVVYMIYLRHFLLFWRYVLPIANHDLSELSLPLLYFVFLQPVLDAAHLTWFVHVVHAFHRSFWYLDHLCGSLFSLLLLPSYMLLALALIT